jgi:microsomal epoxide hydrolase
MDLSEMYIDKPTGFSSFPYELMPAPRGWVEGSANVVLYREHERGELWSCVMWTKG